MNWRQVALLSVAMVAGSMVHADNVISGKVTFSGGTPPPMTEVSVMAGGSCSANPAPLNPYGQYELRGIKGAGVCLLSLVHNGESIASINIPLTGYHTNANLLLRSWPGGRWLVTRQ